MKKTVLRGLLRGLLCLLPLVLTACSPILQRPASPGLHDLGSLRSALPVRVMPAKIDVHAPGWLDGTALHYRLAYESATRRLSYAGSRWAAPPAELLQVALVRMLEAPGEVPGCRLVVELDEFIQVFDQPAQSSALVSGVATLVDARGRYILDRMRFTLTEPATTADAAGGVDALSRAVDALGHRLADWLDRGLPKGNDPRCGE